MSKPDPKNATELALGMKGTLRGDAFELVGRAHVASRGGGHWNEWRAVFADGHEGWLAEAAARFYFMFEAPLLDVDTPPPGALASARWVVGERDHAKRVATYGDVAPLTPGDAAHEYRYVDLSGPEGRVATVDYGDLHPRTFVGRKVTLAELSLAPAREPVYGKVARGQRPDSELAVNGSVSLAGTAYKIFATVVRSAPDADPEDPSEKDPRFSWLEHLLYLRGHGLSWLVELPDEYRLVEQVEAGAVEIRDGAARYAGATWKKTHSGLARTDGAWGMLPWVPRIGEESTAIDYEHKDRALSVEQNEREVAWAVSTPLDEDEVVYARGPNEGVVTPVRN